jgi:hypothetical protein
MTGAIEFLRKAKAICESRKTCHNCEICEICGCPENFYDEADLVRKVMDYQIKEVTK